jgi:NAD(P)H-hydrate repair Nnr-like enzyme with NAD(P)H-hydrate dehydratase domain
MAWHDEAGDVGFATSGSGDTLAGLVVGLLARGASPETAAFWGIDAHGEAGRCLGRRCHGAGHPAREIRKDIPNVRAGTVG